MRGKQNGFTLIDIVVSVAITGILGLGISVFAIQTVQETGRSSSRMQVIQQLENAGYWISRDAQTAQTITVGQTGGFPLELTWTDASNDNFAVTFSLTDGQIRRSLVKNGGTAQQTQIAQSINSDPALTYCTYSGSMLTFNATATIASSNISRTYHILKRTW
jgi:type II secretory pathway component PulJ